MLKINFSDIYNKLLNRYNDVIEIAILLGVYEINLEEQDQMFLNYDTDYGKYKLPKKGKYLMLLFEKIEPFSYESCRNLFTTLRRYTPKKTEYYKSNIGKKFSVNITNRSTGACASGREN